MPYPTNNTNLLGNAGNDPLILVKQYTSVPHLNLSYQTLLPNFCEARNIWFKELLGNQFVDFIEGNPTDDAIHYVRYALINYSLYLMSDKQQIVLADMGVNENNDRANTSRPSSDGRRGDAKWSLIQSAYDHIEQLFFDILLPNISHYTGVMDGTIYTKYMALLLNSPRTYQEFGGRLKQRGRLEDWLQLYNTMSTAQNSQLLPFLCRLQYDELLKIANNTITAPSALQKELLRLCREFVAAITDRDAPGRNDLKFTAHGTKHRTPQKTNLLNKNPDYRDYEHSYQGAIDRVAEAASAIKVFLSANATDFPLWEASSCNQANQSNQLSSIPSICGCQANCCHCHHSSNTTAGGLVAF